MEHFDELVTDRAIGLQDVKSYVAAQQADERFSVSIGLSLLLAPAVFRDCLSTVAPSGSPRWPQLFVHFKVLASSSISPIAPRWIESALMHFGISRTRDAVD